MTQIDKDKKIKEEVKYLTNRSKIKNFIEEIGVAHILQYLIEQIDSYEIDSDEDLWRFRFADSLEDAYDQYINHIKESNSNAKDQEPTL